jgi:hypothetical protein
MFTAYSVEGTFRQGSQAIQSDIQNNNKHLKVSHLIIRWLFCVHGEESISAGELNDLEALICGRK